MFGRPLGVLTRFRAPSPQMAPIPNPVLLSPSIAFFGEFDCAVVWPSMYLHPFKSRAQASVVNRAFFLPDTSPEARFQLPPKTTPAARFFQAEQNQTQSMGVGQLAQGRLGGVG